MAAHPLALAVALLAAAPAPAGPRVPGMALRFGQSLGSVDSTHAFRAEAAPAPGAALRSGTARFFGIPAEVKLHFEGGRLARVEARVESPAPHQIDYLRDELRRLGCARECRSNDLDGFDCTYRSDALIQIAASPKELRASLTPVPADRLAAPADTAAAAPRAARADTTGVAPSVAGADTVAAGASPGPAAAPTTLVEADPALPLFRLQPGDTVAGFPVPAVRHREPPQYPETARSSGLQGRVSVEALVDSSGAIVEARVTRGVPMLDESALACVRRWRFAPYVWQGRARSFRIVIPVLFTFF